jgi:uncharacterized protein (DUF488 family)
MIFTVGHSTRTANELLVLLETYGVNGLTDVRTVPRSRRHPQFSADALATFLAAHGIKYMHRRHLVGSGTQGPIPSTVPGTIPDSADVRITCKQASLPQHSRS